MNEAKYIVATDGASNTNHIKANQFSIAGWGALVLKDGTYIHKLSGRIDGVLATNIRAELVAALEGLKATPLGSSVELFTDSEYVIKGLTQWMDNWKKKGWRNSAKKPVAHKDLWTELDELYQNREVQLTWVKGHSGHLLNEEADTLAKEAMAS